MKKTTILGLSFLGLAPVTVLAAVSIPLTVQEALPSGVSGLARVGEPVTVGVPLSESSGITDIRSFTISGAASAPQFRVLARWPNGNIRWLLTDFQANVPAGGTAQVTLQNLGRTTASPLPVPNLARDEGAAISINTGKARFTIRKSNFNLFDQVIVDGITLVASGEGRLAMRDVSDKEYSSAHDSQSTAVIEENGPIRTVVKTTGAFKDSVGTRLADYTLRLQFYRGKAYVKGNLQLRNANKNFPAALYFHSAEAIVPLLARQPVAVLARKTDAVTSTLGPGQRAQLLQGYSKDKLMGYTNGCYGWEPPVPGTCASGAYNYTYDLAASGLLINVADTPINGPGDPNQWTQGWAELRDAGGAGVTLGMRWMSAYWPAGFDLGSDGTASVELFSKLNPKPSLKLGFGKHEGRELIWDFHSTSADNGKVLHTLNYPLIARAPFSHYQSARALFGQSEFVSVAEQAQFFAALGQAGLFKGFDNPAMGAVYRFWPWSLAGGDNQTDFPLNDLQDYLRSGLAGFYLAGEHRTLFNGWTAIEYSDNFSLDLISQVVDPESGRSSLNGLVFDSEHAHMLSLPFYYFLSGNEDIKDAVLEYGEMLDRWQLKGYFKIPNTQYFRAWSRVYRNLALIYEFTCQIGPCNGRYRSYVENATDTLLDSRDDPALELKSPHGRNPGRGYVYWDSSISTASTGRVVHSFVHTQIHFEAIWQGLRILRSYGTPYIRGEEVEDYLHGLAQFFFDEYYDNFGSAANQAGFQYDYPLDKPYERPPTVQPSDVGRAGWFAFYKTGSTSYLAKAYDLVWRTTAYASKRTPSELQDQALMNTYFRLPGWWKPLTVTATPTSGGYTLSWTVPAGARAFQVKYSDKPIVEGLGFDRTARTFQYDPVQWTPYFAASNLSTEPAVPASGGGTVALPVSGLACLPNCYFAGKYYSQ